VQPPETALDEWKMVEHQQHSALLLPFSNQVRYYSAGRSPITVPSAMNWIVGSEVAHLVSLMLATVRRPNCTCGFPACSFHEDLATPRRKRRN
jgi:hypothetical protein